MKTKELAKTETAAVVAFTSNTAEINTDNIILPGLSIRQNSFKKDSLKKMSPGDVFMRPDDVVIGGETKGAAFVLVGIEPAFRIKKVEGQDKKVIRYDRFDHTVKNEYNFSDKGEDFVRENVFVAHILLREIMGKQAALFERIAKGEFVDPSDMALPCRVVFGGNKASLTTGKQLASHAELSKSTGQTIAGITFVLKTAEVKSDKGTYYAFTVAKADKDDKYTPKEIAKAADFWVGMLAKKNYKSVAEEIEETEAPANPIEETF